MKDLTFRWARPSDRDGILALTRNRFSLYAEADRRPPGECCKVALLGDQLVGLLVYGPTAVTGPACCRLKYVLVRADLRRRGIGRFMVETLVGPRSPRARRQACAIVPEESAAAVAFFDRSAFRKVETRYQDGKRWYAYAYQPSEVRA